ncbi:MAG TPA: hypothetical protein VK655_00185 [Solirubrobacteraceae bacterium]|nr:hypothetical protein [Solirubrobacteraceae bacterium]
MNGIPLDSRNEPTATKGKGTLKLTDTNFPIIKGPVGVECEDATEGKAVGATKGEVTKWTLSKCAPTTSKGCETGTGSVIEVQAVNLPWAVELVAAGSSVDEKLVTSGKGTPGFAVKCKIFGINNEDVCTASLTASTTNVTGGVTAAFVASEKLNCTDGGTGSGVLEGSTSIEATSGGKLSAELEKPPIWRVSGTPITSATAIYWKGKVTVNDTLSSFGELEVECKDTGTGSVGPEEVSEMTKWTLSECQDKRGCSGSTHSIEAMSLPWHSELFSIESGVQNLTSGGGFKFTCVVSGVTIEDECNFVPAAKLTNTSSGVTDEMWEYRSCTLGRNGAGKITGTQEIKTNTGTLSAS